MLRNDVPSSAKRRLSVRRLTATDLATVCGVRAVSPRCSTSICRTRTLSGPESCRSRSVNTLSSRRRTIEDSASSAACMERVASVALKIIEFEPASKRTELRKNGWCSDSSSGAECLKHTCCGATSAPVLSRASFSAIARANSARPGCNAVLPVSRISSSKPSPWVSVRATTRSLSTCPYRARRSNPAASDALERKAYSTRSSAPRGSHSARCTPTAESAVSLDARRQALSADASATRRSGSDKSARPGNRRIDVLSNPWFSTHASRCGRTHACTDGPSLDASTVLPEPLGPTADD